MNEETPFERGGERGVNDTEVLVFDVQTMEEARLDAAEAWGVDPSDVSLTTLEEDKRFFGFLGKKLRVEARPVAPLSLLRGKSLAKELIALMDLHISPELDESHMINLVGDDAGIIIGKYGETLKAMEFLLNLMARQADEGERIRLDSDGYRERREESLRRLALSAARETSRRRRPTYLEPMTSWERRIIHMTLQDREGIETRSMGEAPYRRVVVWPTGALEREYDRR